MKALPDEVRKTVPKNLDPESLAAVLKTIEALLPSGDDNGAGRGFSGTPRPKTGGPPAGDLDAANKQFADLQMRRMAPGVRR